MIKSSLSVAIKNAEYEIPNAIRLLRRGPLASFQDIHQICTLFRQRGVASLFLTGEPDAYYINAMQSAAAFLFELKRQGPEVSVLSFARPLFDAVSAGYWDAALEIGRCNRQAWSPDDEYEDDFLYVRFLVDHCLLGASHQHCTALLERRYRVVLEGARDVRLQLCHALLQRDSAGFDAALRGLLDMRRDLVKEMLDREVLSGDPSTWITHFALEGVALLKLAERLGLATGRDYLHCPELVRPESPYRFHPSAWVDLHFSARPPETS